MSRSGFYAKQPATPFASFWPGRCCSCGELFKIGTPIRRQGDKFRHAECEVGDE